MSNELTTRFRFFSWWGRLWRLLDERWAWLTRRVRRKQRQLSAEARLLSAEVIQLGAQLRDKVDDLPFLPTSFRLRPVRTQFYGHGAFMGAAPALLADARWRRILAFLMPDVFEQVRAALGQSAGPQQIIQMMENNPVLAAFGVFEHARSRRDDHEESPLHLSGLEWDLFVDADLIDDWRRARGDEAALAAVMERVIDTALIAHATAADTVQESIGICQYRDVRRTPKTSLGGVELDSWLDFFGRALALARAPSFDEALAEMAREPRSSSDEECMLHTFAPPWPVRRVVDLHREVTGRACLSIIIDIKSLRSTPEFLCDVVAALNARGVHVAAVGSFLREEIDGVGQALQRVDGVAYPAPREIQFFHYVGDLQAACDAGEVSPGQSVMFNGASLLDHVETGGGRPVYSSRLRVVAELELYRQRFDLQIGFYVQEGDCDHAAAALLSELSEAFPHTFALGFAWGGLRDQAHLDASELPRLGYGSQRMLGYVGKARLWRVSSPGD